MPPKGAVRYKVDRMSVDFDAKLTDRAAAILRDAVQAYDPVTALNSVLAASNMSMLGRFDVTGSFTAVTGSFPALTGSFPALSRSVPPPSRSLPPPSPVFWR